MTALLRYDAACHALAEAKSFDEVRDWEDKAAAVREYSRRARNRGLELDALEIRERARLRRGELLLALKAAEQLADSRKKPVDGQRPVFTLEQLDVSKDESSRDQRIAQLGTDGFERRLATCRAYAEEHPEKHTFDVLRAPEAPVNGARSIMGSRQEPDDSLDFFPTPLWATRALLDSVFRHLGGLPSAPSIWEPACGQGHMSEPLKESGAKVFATDIFNYGGHQDRVWDFLSDQKAKWAKPNRFDLIITNPPFGDRTEAFVLRALDLARVGVAMFVRLQWLETIGRYEAIFRDRPPTLIAFFAERVNLCKGRWEPYGGTATAYIWMVWIKDRAPLAPFWIPPGRREALTRPDDAVRFAPHLASLAPAKEDIRHALRAEFPNGVASHVIRHTIDWSAGVPGVSVATCECGAVYRSSRDLPMSGHDELDKHIAAHWRAMSSAPPRKVDPNQIDLEDAIAAKTPTREAAE